MSHISNNNKKNHSLMPNMIFRKTLWSSARYSVKYKAFSPPVHDWSVLFGPAPAETSDDKDKVYHQDAFGTPGLHFILSWFLIIICSDSACTVT